MYIVHLRADEQDTNQDQGATRTRDRYEVEDERLHLSDWGISIFDQPMNPGTRARVMLPWHRVLSVERIDPES